MRVPQVDGSVAAPAQPAVDYCPFGKPREEDESALFIVANIPFIEKGVVFPIYAISKTSRVRAQVVPSRDGGVWSYGNIGKVFTDILILALFFTFGFLFL